MSGPAFDPARLEDVLTEIGRQLVARGATGLEGLDLKDLGLGGGPWGCTPLASDVCPDGVGAMVRAGACRVGVCGPDPTRLGDLASYLDHTLLKPDATVAEIDRLCDEALRHGFASVCINGTWVRRCAEILAGSSVLVCSVAGFPLGAMAPEVKTYEARRAIEDGACEIDVVQNVGALKSGDLALVRRDLAGAAETCHRHGARLKVILETCLLTDEEKVRACRIAREAGADFVKTSTGFSTGGATVEDVELMRRTVGPDVGVKASGGVRDRDAAQAMIAAGATRIGASASVAIVRGGTRSGEG